MMDKNEFVNKVLDILKINSISLMTRTDLEQLYDEVISPLELTIEDLKEELETMEDDLTSF